MKYIKTLIGALFATTLLITVAPAAPSTNAPLATPNSKLDKWTFSLSGGGSSEIGNTAKDGSAIGGEFQLGRTTKLIFPAELGVRQGISYSDASDSSWLLGTKVYSDWTIARLGNLEFDGGANIGIQYGNQPLKWTAAPELVTRLYLKRDVDLFVRIEYPFDLNSGRAESRLNYLLGVRVKF